MKHNWQGKFSLGGKCPDASHSKQITGQAEPWMRAPENSVGIGPPAPHPTRIESSTSSPNGIDR